MQSAVSLIYSIILCRLFAERLRRQENGTQVSNSLFRGQKIMRLTFSLLHCHIRWTDSQIGQCVSVRLFWCHENYTHKTNVLRKNRSVSSLLQENMTFIFIDISDAAATSKFDKFATAECLNLAVIIMQSWMKTFKNKGIKKWTCLWVSYFQHRCDLDQGHWNW